MQGPPRGPRDDTGLAGLMAVSRLFPCWALQLGQAFETGGGLGPVEMMFVMGKRTHSVRAARQPALRRLCQWLQNTSAEAGLEKETANPGLLAPGEPPPPHGARGVAHLLPQGLLQRQCGEMGLWPLPCLPRRPCQGVGVVRGAGRALRDPSARCTDGDLLPCFQLWFQLLLLSGS